MPFCPSARVWSRLVVGVALTVSSTVAAALVWVPADAAGTAYFVAPTGADTNSGTSATAPFRTIQKALDLAQPGTTITLAPGRYVEAVVTKVAGIAAAPITVKGPETGTALAGRDKAVLVSPAGRTFSINHSFYTLDGFTIDGQPNIPRSDYPAGVSLSGIKPFKDSVSTRAVNSKLVYVGASSTSADIVGTTISNMFLTGSGGECVRFRNRAANSTVVNSVIQWCGLYASGDDVDKYKYHNAEGVYVGTSPKSTDQPMFANDSSNGVVVRNSTINTFGSECFEVKENAHDNRLENTDCGWNDEPASFQGSNVELRGDHNTVLGNRLSTSRSWNLKLASDSPTYDRGGNTAQGNAFSGAATYAIVNRQTGPGPICGNTFTGPVSDPSGGSVGAPSAACTGATPPVVMDRLPAGNATGVPVAGNLTATFSKTVQGVDGTTFTLRAAGATTDVPAVVTYDAATGTAVLDPAADLATNTQYTATLTGGATAIRDLTNTPLVTVSWAFSTVAPADTTPPTVTARTPPDKATGVPVGNTVTATFSEPVQGADAPGAFVLKAGTTVVGATVSYDATSRVATLKPAAALAADTPYTATLADGIKDAAGNPLAPVSWAFTTAAPAAPADTAAPTVTSQTPSAGVTGVDRTKNVTATFSEPVQGVSGSTFTLRAGTSSAVAATVTYDAGTRVATLNPTADLAASTRYTATVTGGNGVRDLAGNPLTTVTWTFTTAAPADTTAPTVTSRSPSAGATSVSRTGDVTATFNEAVTGVSATTLVLRNAGGATVSAVVTRDGTNPNKWILNPSSTLPSFTRFTVFVTGGTSAIRDTAGNPLATVSWTFTTGR
jgi:hypothetical protein